MKHHSQASERTLRLFRWFCHADYQEEIEGDLLERFATNAVEQGDKRAQWMLLRDVITLFRPGLIRSFYPNFHLIMFRQNVTISWRTLLKNKGFSFINISGLALGMCIAMLIGLWVHDELQYNRDFTNRDQIGRVMQHRTFDGETQTWQWTMYPLAEELRTNYGHLFQRIAKGSYREGAALKLSEETITQPGMYLEIEGLDLLDLEMLRGERADLAGPDKIFLSASLAERLYQEDDPIGKTITLNNALLEITGVYADFPLNSDFRETEFLGSWELYTTLNRWIREMETPWRPNSFQTLVQLKDNIDWATANPAIENVIAEKTAHIASVAGSKPRTFLHPMSKWYLESNFENGAYAGGRIDNVWLFGGIGLFILFLACINFMNLSTARSEQRAHEVGVRKVLGSARSQLIAQFYSDAILMAGLAYVLAVSFVLFALPAFNEIAGKEITIPWGNLYWWGIGLGVVVITALLSGSYPAFYLSSFPIMRAFRPAAVGGQRLITPRRVLVVFQFTIAVSLMVGVLIIHKQVEYGKNRSLGFTQDNLIMAGVWSREVARHYELITTQIDDLNEVTSVSGTEVPLSVVGSTTSGVEWQGKTPGTGVNFVSVGIGQGFGPTVDWEMVNGRNFSDELASDSSAVIINETTARIIGFENPIGEVLNLEEDRFRIIGVVKDIVNDSPYLPSLPHLYFLRDGYSPYLHFRMAEEADAGATIAKVEAILKAQDPDAIVDFFYMDEEYAEKLEGEVSMGRLVSVFTLLAIFISCLGLFGLVAYMAERRKKEISIRKVLGAGLGSLWGTLSKEFIVLIIVAFGLSIPVAYYFLNNWLDKYAYHTDLGWEAFALAGIATLLVTLATVSFQTIKAALLNPVEALR